MRYFLDTEFNGMGGELISLALVSEREHRFGDPSVFTELYLAGVCRSSVPWVAENVIPVIGCPGATPIFCMMQNAGDYIRGFLSHDPHPYIIADWPDDIAYFCKTLIIGPGKMVDIPSLSFEIIRVDAYPTDLPGAVQHNALWDARALRHKIMNDHKPASALY